MCNSKHFDQMIEVKLKDINSILFVIKYAVCTLFVFVALLKQNKINWF